MKKQIQINPADNVVVAVDTLSAGDNITVGTTHCPRRNSGRSQSGAARL